MACEKFEGNLGEFILQENIFKSIEGRKDKKGPQLIQMMKDLALQAAEGLEYLHGRGSVHKDIKPRNFVVRRGDEGGVEWICKLADMGFTKMTTDGGSWASATNQLGTRKWGLAPELLNSQPDGDSATGNSNFIEETKIPFSKKSDVWTFGLVLHFIFSEGGHPYGKTENQWLQNIIDGKMTDEGKAVLKRISKPTMAVDDLVAKTLSTDPRIRPDMREVVATIKEWQ